MTETTGDSPERKRPAKMAVGMGEKAVSETLRSPETRTPSQRVIDFVKQTAVFDDGETSDIVKAGVLTNMDNLEGLVLRSRIINSDFDFLDESKKDLIYCIGVTYPGGYFDSVDVSTDGRLAYVFGNDEGCEFSDLSDEEERGLVDSFFIRYGLNHYAQHPERWQPEVR